MGRFENWRGVIDKPILGLLTFGRNLDVSEFGSKLIHFVRGDTAANPQTLQYRNDVSSQMAYRYTRTSDAV